MIKNSKIIFHIDADSFFSSCEIAIRPELKDKDVAICANNKSNAIVSALSYSAKLKGAKVPMKLYQVKQFCPNVVVIKLNFNLYNNFSKRIYQILKKNYAKDVEIGSIDEWYIDVTKYEKLYKSPTELAKKIQQHIANELNLTVSIGISYNKFLAKMATDLNKPNGITQISKKNIPNLIWPLPIESYVGIGRSLSSSLKRENINTIGDLANIDINDSKFKKIFKNKFDYYINNAWGIGDNKIDLSHNERNSIGAQTTLDHNTSNSYQEITKVLYQNCQRVSSDLRKKDLSTNQVTLLIKNNKLNTISKRTLNPIDSTMDIYNVALRLFNSFWSDDWIIMIGISVNCIENNYQIKKNISLFEEYQKNEISHVKKIVNKINKQKQKKILSILSDKLD